MIWDQSLGSADTRVYAYDFNGNLTQKQTLPEVGTYAYDALDRLTQESATGATPDANTYTYDPNGNRLSELKPNGTERTYAYAPNTTASPKRATKRSPSMPPATPRRTETTTACSPGTTPGA